MICCCGDLHSDLDFEEVKKERSTRKSTIFMRSKYLVKAAVSLVNLAAEDIVSRSMSR